MDAPKPDAKAIACNFLEGTSPCSKGAFAWVLYPYNGDGSLRVMLLARSRSGRWIRKAEATYRLTNFRVKTVPPEAPFYSEFAHNWGPTPDYSYLMEQVRTLTEVAERERELRAFGCNLAATSEPHGV